MKRFFAVAALSAVVSFFAPLAAQGQSSPEDRYVVIYNLIQEAESLNEAGSASDALAKYQEAQSALQKFQGEFPDWNPRVVSFRLDYVASRITPLAGRIAAAPPSAPAGAPVAAPLPKPAPRPSVPGDVSGQIKALQEQVREAQADKAQLEARLQQALAAPAPAVVTTQAAGADERITALQKETDRLKAELEQQRASAAQRIEPALLEQTRLALEEANRKIAQQNESTFALTREKESMQKQVDSLSAAAAASAKTSAELEQSKRALEEAQHRLNQQAEAASVLLREKEALQKSVDDLAVKAKAADQLEPARQSLVDANRKLAQQNEVASALTREKEVLQNQVRRLSAAGSASSKTAADLEQARRALDEARRNADQQTQAVAVLAREKEALQKSVNELSLKAKAANEFARAEEKIRGLQRENDLLKGSLAQPKAGPGRPADATALARTQQELADTRRKLQAQTEAASLRTAEANRKLEQQTRTIAAITQEKNALQKRLAPLAANAEALAALRAENEVLKKRLAQSPAKPVTPARPQDTGRPSPQAEAQLAALQSERDMLRLEKIALEQKLKAKSALPAPAVATPSPATDTGRPSPQVQAELAALQSERDMLRLEKIALQQTLKEKPAMPVSAAVQPSPVTADQANQIKRLEQERDELRKKLVAVGKQPTARPAPATPAQIQTLSNQVNTLRARLGVFEARPIPYTAEELALFKKPEPKLAEMAPQPADKTVPKSLATAMVLDTEAQRYFATRQFDKAEEKYSRLLRQDNQSVLTLANLAAVQLEQGRLDEAEKNLKQALALDANDAFSLEILGSLKYRQEKFDEALAALSRAAQLNPRSPRVQNYLGITLSHKGMRGQAETALRTAIQLDPNYAGAHNNLAVVYATQQPPALELARWHYQKALAAGHPRNLDLEKILETSTPAKSP